MSEPSERTKVPRRLAAILAADIAGYSALIGANEARTVRDLKDRLAVVLPMVSSHGGRVIDTAGDGILAEFGSVVNAVECATAIQKTMMARNAVGNGEQAGRAREAALAVCPELTIASFLLSQSRKRPEDASRLKRAAPPALRTAQQSRYLGWLGRSSTPVRAHCWSPIGKSSRTPRSSSLRAPLPS